MNNASTKKTSRLLDLLKDKHLERIKDLDPKTIMINEIIPNLERIIKLEILLTASENGTGCPNGELHSRKRTMTLTEEDKTFLKDFKAMENQLELEIIGGKKDGV